MTFASVAATNENVRLWLPCNEGSGTTLTNEARDGSNAFASLGATAWDNYATGAARAAVALGVHTSVPLSYPYDPVRPIFGNRRTSTTELDSIFSALMVRYEGAITIGQIETDTNSRYHGLTISGGDITFSACGHGLWTDTLGAGTRVIAAAAFTEIADPFGEADGDPAGFLRTQWALLELDDGDLSEVQGLHGDVAHQAPLTTTDDAGYPGSANLDLTNIGGTSSELFAMVMAQMPFGKRPCFGGSGELLKQLRIQAPLWGDGTTKDIPTEWYTTCAATGASGKTRRGKPGSR